MAAKFDISVLPLGQGAIAMCRMPGALGDLVSDVQALSALGPTAVLSLTPLDEMANVGAGALPDMLAVRGIDWLHLPITDFGIPSRAQQDDWNSLSCDLQARLDAGETVVIHCRAGLGRTGMVALRLMVDRAERPEGALTRLRAIRPGAVERPEQFDWASKEFGLR